jgi:hypothetical protein
VRQAASAILDLDAVGSHQSAVASRKPSFNRESLHLSYPDAGVDLHLLGDERAALNGAARHKAFADHGGADTGDYLAANSEFAGGVLRENACDLIESAFAFLYEAGDDRLVGPTQAAHCDTVSDAERTRHTCIGQFDALPENLKTPVIDPADSADDFAHYDNSVGRP